MKYVLFFISSSLCSFLFANDLCTNAISITPSTTCNYITGSMSGASISSAAPSCASSSLQDVWYSFVATDPQMSISMGSAFGLNQAFEIITGSCTGASLVCINNNGTNSSESYQASSFVVGQTYYIRVLNAGGNLSTANFSICVVSYPAPTNDLCTSAISIAPSTTCNYITGSMSGASISSAAPSCASSSLQDVWYSFVATDPQMSISMGSAFGLNQAFEIITGSCTGASLVCINNNGTNSSESYQASSFVVGQTYYIRVLNAGGNLSTANFSICVVSYPAPTNDLCTSAISLTPSTTCNYTTGSMSGASISSAAPSCASSSLQDVWYSFVATDPQMSISMGSAFGLNQAFEIITGSCTGASLVCINNNGTNSSESYQASSFVVGQTYYIRVLNAGGNLSTANFSICVQSYPSQVNDLCANAISLTPSTTCNYTTGSMSGASISSAAPSCASSSLQDVWYSFVATDPQMSISMGSAFGLNQAFEIITGSCTGASLVCINNNGTNSSESYQASSFVVGQTYYIRVLNAGGNLSTANFSICVQISSCTPSISISSSISSICFGETVNFSSSITDGGNSPAFQWKKNGVNVGTNLSTYSDNTIVNGDQISCDLISNAACSTTPLVNSNTISVVVLNPVTPAIVIASSDLNLCDGDFANFTCTVTDGGNSPSFQWKKNGNNVGSNTTTLSISNLLDNDGISCELTTSLSCYTSQTALSNSLTVNVTTIVTTVGQGSQTGVGPIYFALQTPGTYQWIDCATLLPIPGQTSSLFRPRLLGLPTSTYAVVLNYNGCADTSDCFAYTAPTNSLEEDILQKIEIYPNPSQDFVKIHLPNTFAQVELIIFDQSGRIVLEQSVKNETILNIGELQSGLYRVHLTMKDRQISKSLKFIKL